MSRQVRILLILGLLLALGIGSAVFVVLGSGEPDYASNPADEEAVTEEDDGEEETAADTGRKRARTGGNSEIHGLVVRGEEEEIVADHTVVLTLDDGDTIDVTTDASGAFRFANLRHGGPYEVTVAEEGFATVRLPGIALDRNEKRDVGTLVLDAAVRLEIEVRAMNGEAIEGATVNAYAVPVGWSWGMDWQKMMAQMGQEPVPVASAKTDASGKTVFPELATGGWTVTAKREGYAMRGRPSISLRAKEDREPVVIYLGRGYPLTGKVLDQDGKPLPGALVMAGGSSNSWMPSAAPLRSRSIASADGSYSLDSLEFGDTQVWASTPGGAPGVVATVRIPGVEHFDITLRDGGILQGTVTDSDTSEPIAGATVTAMSWGSMGSQVAMVETDEEGKYRIDTLPEGMVNQVTVKKEGLVQDPPEGGQNQQIATRRGVETVRDYTMSKGASLKGMITGPDGMGLSGARINAMSYSQTRGFVQEMTTADSLGKYEYTALPPGKVMLQVNHAGFYQKDFPQNWWQSMQSGNAPEEYTVDLEAGESHELDITLGVGTTVSGKVVTADGEPVAGARVTTTANNAWMNPIAPAMSASDGTFVLESVAPAKQVRIVASKADLVVEMNDPIDEIENTPIEDIVLTMHPLPVVRGTVLDDNGEPVDDAYVRVNFQPDGSNGPVWWDPESWWKTADRHPVDADGSYELAIPGLAGTFTIYADAANRAGVTSDSVTLTDGQTEYEQNIEFGPGYAIEGVVLTKGGGQPIGFAEIRVTPQSTGNNRGMHFVGPWGGNAGTIYAVADGAGNFVVEGLSAAGYSVTADTQDYVAGSKTTKVPGGSALTIELEPELEISGTVEMSDGSPVEGVSVSAVKDGGNSGNSMPMYPGMGGNSSATTDAAGSFTIRGLGAGSYKLNVQPMWNSKANIRPFEGQATAGTSNVKLVAQAGMTISGTVVNEEGEGIANAWVNANPKVPKSGANQWRNTQTKEDGSFELVGLDSEAGLYNLNVNVQSFGTAEYPNKQVTDVSPGTTGLEIRMERGMSIEGVINLDGIDGVQSGWVMAEPIKEEGAEDSRNGQNGMMDEEGNFKIPGLQPGAYTLRLWTWGGSNNQQWALEGGDRVEAGATGLVLTPTKGATITGRVVDDSGGGVQGVSVMANPEGGGQGAHANTDENGDFELSGLITGKTYNITAQPQGKIGSTVNGIDPGASGITLTVTEGVTLTGQLRNSTGDAVSGATIWLSPIRQEGDPPATNQQAATDEDGNFEIGGLASGITYNANTWAQDSNGGWSSKSLGQVSADDGHVMLEIPEDE